MEHIQKVQIDSVGTRYAVLDLLKWFAIITMVVDHISILFPDQSYLLRSIGRWAFPLFCLILAFNLHTAINSQKTTTLSNYFKNLFIFSLLSEIPYQMYITGPFETLSVMPTLLIGFILVVLGESTKKSDTILFFILALITIFFSKYIMYGFYGVFLIATIYLSLKVSSANKQKTLVILSGILAALGNLSAWYIGGFYNYIETYPMAFSFAVNSFLATVIGCIILLNISNIDLKLNIPRIGKWAYLFYPIHLVIIYVLSKIVF